ncbi:hypothetical protein [Pyrobaculum calidifontis]|uniref:Uncharacterized protein n=1 Tax=Pyrobaculum calidifontis (strain DSM 21063 / JCM 11548 / VA1) TaxID=410359 RepID=A3MSY0_PYRCJ|nr:hypothetical protein [Pyrobaculum calidifontis]ABO07747.1 conserved hypothetical protein [Pyrobaculum calidifontis JCM 11548]
MKLAYVKGPLVAVFAGSWLCEKSPVDGVPILLGEPIGECAGDVARLISIATTVRAVKRLGARVYVSEALGADGVDAAFAGGADGVVEELGASKDAAGGTQAVVVEAGDVAELLNKARRLGEEVRRGFEVLVAAPFDKAVELAPFVDGVVLTGGWVEVGLEEVGHVPEVGRCTACGVDYLMYGETIRRCVYCGRRLVKVITSTRPPRSRPVFRAVAKKYLKLAIHRFKVV